MKTSSRLYIIIYIAIIITSFASCENEIPYNPGTQEPQLIMNALLDAGATENYVYLHMNRGYNLEQLKEATLTLSVNDRTETLEAISPEEYYKDVIDKFDEEAFKHIVENMRFTPFRLTASFHPGDRIRLEANAENGKYHASAEVIVPHPVEQLHVDTCTVYLREYHKQTPYRQYKITLQDRPNEKNYYRLDIRNENSYRLLWKENKGEENEVTRDTIVSGYKSCEIINREDVILTDGHPTGYDDEGNELFPTITNKYNIFNDSMFRNSHATLRVYTPLNFPGYPTYTWNHYYEEIYHTQTITIRLLTLTEAEYRYLKALNCLKDDNYDESLMEPVCLPSNVNGGLGFVGICSETNVILKMPEQSIFNIYTEEENPYNT